MHITPTTFFFLRFFWCGPFFTCLLNLLQYCFWFFLSFFFFFFEPQSMWDLSSLTSLWTHTPCVGRWSHSHWISREVPNVTPNISIKVILDILQNFAMLSQQYGKESACHAGDLGWIPGSERYPEKGMATHSSTLAWRISRTEEPVGLQSTRLQRVGHDWATNTTTQ